MRRWNVIAQQRPRGLHVSSWAIACLLLAACLMLSSCIYVPIDFVDPAVLDLLNQQLLALRKNDAEAVVSGGLYYDYTTKEYLKGTQKDVEQTQSWLKNNPELWNFQSYTITEAYRIGFPMNRAYRIRIKLWYEDGRTRPFDFFFRYEDSNWWVTEVTTNGLIADD